MELFLLLGMFGLGMGALIFQDDTPEEEPPTPEEPLDLTLLDSVDVTGTDGDDTISVADGVTTLEDMTIATGAGADHIALADPGGTSPVDSASTYIFGSDIDAGAGNDTVTALVDSTTISGGDGDDVLTVAGAASYVYGDAGDDTLTLDGMFGEVVADGGTGNDLIDATRVTLGNISGGEGNDHIMASSYNSVGQGVMIDGGAGDDTIDVDVRSPTDSWDFLFPVSGGEGADTFNIRIGEGIDEPGNDSTTDTTVRAQVIEDFDPAADTLVIEPILNQDTSTLTGVSLQEASDPSDGAGTEIVLSYDLGTATRDVVIWLPGATGMTLDDISLVGDLVAGLA